ncbi:ATP-binding cassette domain-containing protein [Okibacterium endophyticum]
MTTESIISARGLTKEFTAKKTTTQAVTDLSLDVGRGELVAFLGPNGAGKSTSLRMLTTLTPPTRGTAHVTGFDILTQPAEVRRRIGYIGQGNSAGHNFRVRDELRSQGAFYGMRRPVAERRADELIESLDLTALATRPVLTLSGGQKRRLDIALGLIHSPELLFLDEPSTGLDPQSRANLWHHLMDLRREHGTTIFVTTHYLEEADQYAERVMVMDHGRMIADDTASALKTNLAGDVMTLGFTDDRDAARALEIVRRIAGRRVSADGATVVATVEKGDRMLPTVLRELDAASLPVQTSTLRQPTLDDVFLALTGRTLREEATIPAPEPVPTASASTEGASA